MAPERTPDAVRQYVLEFSRTTVRVIIEYWDEAGKHHSSIDTSLDQVMVMALQHTAGIGRINDLIHQQDPNEITDSKPTVAMSEQLTQLNGQAIRVRVHVEVQHDVPPVFLAGVFEPVFSGAGPAAAFALDPDGLQHLYEPRGGAFLRAGVMLASDHVADGEPGVPPTENREGGYL